MLWAAIGYRFVDPLLVGFEPQSTVWSCHQGVEESLAAWVRVR